jgi:hypothetical protein
MPPAAAPLTLDCLLAVLLPSASAGASGERLDPDAWVEDATNRVFRAALWLRTRALAIFAAARLRVLEAILDSIDLLQRQPHAEGSSLGQATLEGMAAGVFRAEPWTRPPRLPPAMRDRDGPLRSSGIESAAA